MPSNPSQSNWYDPATETYAGQPVQQKRESDAPENPYAWPDGLPKSARQIAEMITNGGLTAEALDAAEHAHMLDKQLRIDAQIIKDAQMTPRGWGWSGVGNNAAWNDLLARDPSLNNVDWAAWRRQMGLVDPVDYTQSTLKWQPRALPEQYRSGANAWLQGQGYSPTGSLGQFGYTQYQKPSTYTGTNPMFTPDLVDSIQDEGLRKWMQYYLSQAGLLQGSYAQPGA